MEWRRVEPVPERAVASGRPAAVWVAIVLVLLGGATAAFAEADLTFIGDGNARHRAIDGSLLPDTSDQILGWGLIILAVTAAPLLYAGERGGRMLGWVVWTGVALRGVGFLRDLFVVPSGAGGLIEGALLFVGILVVLLLVVLMAVALAMALAAPALGRFLEERTPRQA